MSKKKPKTVPCPHCGHDLPLPEFCTKNAWKKCLRCERNFSAFQLYGIFQRKHEDIKVKAPKKQRIPDGFRECMTCGRVIPKQNACRCISERGRKLNPISGEPLPIEEKNVEDGSLNLYAEPEIEFYDGLKVIHSFIDESGWLCVSCEDSKGDIQIRRIRKVL